MATTKHTFVVYAPDKTDPECYARRLSVREKHLAGVKSLISSGATSPINGGAMLTPESITGGEKKMIGSVFIIEGESLSQVTEQIENDIYYTAGVWDPEKLVIAPFAPAVGFGKT